MTTVDSAPDLSFIIPVRDDADRLRKCLESIAANRYIASGVEIVIVDNGSRDTSRTVAEQFGARIVDAPHKRVAELRNMGAQVARGRVLAFVDADHILGPGWIAAALDAISREPGIGGVGSLCQAPSDGTWVQRAYDRLRGRVGGAREVEWLGAGNMAVSRNAFEQVSGFDSALETCEDVELCKRLRLAGFRLVNDDRMINVHLGDPATLGSLFRGELWRGRSNLTVTMRPPVTLREIPSAIAPVMQLAALLVLTYAIVVRRSGVAGLVAAALVPLTLLPLARALRMCVGSGEWRLRAIAENVAVAFAYEWARALALIAFAGHRVRRS